MRKGSRRKDQKWVSDEKQCKNLALLVEKEHSLAWRVYHYLKRHPEMLAENQNAYAVTECIQLIKFSNGKKTVEEAKEWVAFFADMFNNHPHGEEFIPTKEQLEHFNSFPMTTETLMQSVKIFFDHTSEAADNDK